MGEYEKTIARFMIALSALGMLATIVFFGAMAYAILVVLGIM